MNNEFSKLRHAVRVALAAGLAGGVMHSPARAEDDDAAKLDRVEVTGSRIRRTQLEGAMPVTNVTREQIERTGISSIGDLLQELPSAGAALNTNFNNGGNGSTQLDLRNLGPNRVLVLVNGRRWVNSVGNGVPTGVDLNTIPVSIIERIEVLKDGASAIYGSDAIAGVVNIITRKDFDGAQANAYLGRFDEGDGEQQVYDFSVGSSGARTSSFLNATYFKAEPVAAGDRRISREPLFGTQNVLGSSTTPQGRFRIQDPQDLTGQMQVGDPLRFWTGQCTVAFTPPQTCSGAGGTTTGGATTDALANNNPVLGDFRPYSTTNDPYNFAPDNYLATPSERWALYAQGRHDLTDNVTFTTEALYNTRRSEQLLAAMPVTLGPGVTGSATADGTLVGIDGTNPFNPFGLDMNPNSSALGPNDLFLNAVQRRFVETGGRSFNQVVNTFRFGAGLEGSFEMAGRVFDWNLGYSFAENQNSAVTYGLLNTARLRNALGPVTSCTSPCVPLNMFGGVGSITQAMLDYVTFNAHDNQGQDVRNYSGNISGEIFDLPAGPVGLAIGYEWRKETGFDEPDALIAAGNTTGNARSPTQGGYTLDEAYAEFAIPLLSGAPFAEVLEIQVAARQSDYTSFGSTTNTKLGVRWQPFTDLLVRGTFQEGFRAPSIGELFLGQSDSFPNLTDPCSNPASGVTGGLDMTPDDNGTGDPAVAIAEEQLFANCTGQPSPNTSGTGIANPQISGPFVPANGSYGQSNTQIRITVGGNPDLNPETAESTTIGFVYSPSFVDGLSATLDWYSIELEGAITPVGSATILNQCYQGGNDAVCSLITRFGTGDIQDLLASVANVNTMTVEGIDLNVVWRAGELPFVPGDWKFSWDTAWKDTFEVCSTGGCQSFINFNVGDGSLPAFKSNLDIEWSWGDWEATWRMRFIGRQYEFCSSSYTAVGFPCSDPTPGVSENKMGATTYHNAQVSYHLSDWDTRFTFGVLNVGDKSPPLSSQSFANSFDPTNYEIPGRFPYFRISKTF